MIDRVQEIFLQAAQQVSPPIIFNGLKVLVKSLTTARNAIGSASKSVARQDLDVYWDVEMAQVLETWGENSVWKELPLLLVSCQGKILDIACGTGKTMEIISKFPLDVHGCDISDLLIGKAIEKGIRKDHLTVCDATKMPYGNNEFDYAY